MARASALSAAALISPLLKGRVTRRSLYVIGGCRSFGSFLGMLRTSHLRLNSSGSFNVWCGDVSPAIFRSCPRKHDYVRPRYPATSGSTTSPDFRNRKCSSPHPFPTVPEPEIHQRGAHDFNLLRSRTASGAICSIPCIVSRTRSSALLPPSIIERTETNMAGSSPRRSILAARRSTTLSPSKRTPLRGAPSAT